MKHVVSVLLLLLFFAGAARCYDYDQVLRLSLMFYEAQRSGHLPADNRIPWRSDSATADKGQNGEDLSGGYYDGKIAKPSRSSHKNAADYRSIMAQSLL